MSLNTPDLTAAVAPQNETPGLAVEAESTRRAMSRRQLYLRRFLRRPSAVAGAVLLVLLALFAIFGGLFTSYSFTDVDFTALSSEPSSDHVLGTNGAGNDMFAQAVHGLQRSMIIALVVSLASTLIAGVLGTAAAYLGGRSERAILGVTHFLLVLPSFLVLALVGQHYGGDWRVLIVALTVFGWMLHARVVWSLSTSLREREFVKAARFMGVSPLTVVFRHLLPNVASLLIVTFTIGVASTVQAETALSFIGLGVQLPDVSLGTMLSDGANSVTSAPWLFYVPAVLVTLLTVSIALIGDGLRDAFDPTSQSGGKA